MSNYSKQGFRKAKLAETKETKAHLKSFYKIMDDMELLSKKLDLSIDYNEDNINDYVKELYGRDLDSMEKMLVLGKVHYAKEGIVNNIEVKHGEQ
jgi:hypothetical protein